MGDSVTHVNNKNYKPMEAARRRIVARYQENDAAGAPAPTRRELAAMLCVSQTEISYHLRKLREAGILNCSGRRNCLSTRHRIRSTPSFDTPECDANAERHEVSQALRAKPNLALLPFNALAEVAGVFGFGAVKYAPGDWVNDNNGGGDHVAAALRHIGAHCDGEKLDDESGETHLAHASARLLMAIGKRIRNNK